MALPGKPLVWAPHGASDTLDSTTAFNGAMAALTNLIPDPSTLDLWQCRPAAISLNDFSTFNTPTFVSCMKIIGTTAYGMLSTARFPGHDEPFMYDLLANTFTAITGPTLLNTPISPATSGAWQPPNIDLIGAKLIVTHPGFTGVANAFFGVLDIVNPAAPTWTATNTAPTALPAVPVWVANFNGRAWFLVNPAGAQPAAYYSDVLLPTAITAGTQILTFDDNTPLTCAAGLSLNTQLGGVIQALMVFKGVANIYQVTGDAALATLAKNSLNVATGTFAPNSLAQTEKGLAFMAPDGLRLIDFGAHISDPIGTAGTGITVPFIYSVVPSRMAAAFNNGVYRIQTQNGNASGSPQQQWWLDTKRGIWSGPHSQDASLMEPYSNTFVVTLQGVVNLFQSDPVQSATSTYVENGTQLQYAWTTPMFPDTDQMAEIAMVQATLHMALASGNVTTVMVVNQDGTVLDTVTVTVTGSGGSTIWGAFQWGQALWQGSQSALYPQALQWTQPIVSQRLALNAAGDSIQGLKIGRLHMRYEVLGYLQQGNGL